MTAAQGMRAATRVVHAGRSSSGPGAALVPPIPMSIVRSHGGQGPVYGREGNENWTLLEAALTELEAGAAAVAFSSGTAALAAILEQLPRPACVAVAQDAYTGTRELLDHLEASAGWEVRRVDATGQERLVMACRGAQLLLVESLGNPLLSVPDLTTCAQVAHQAGALLVVDNTFATPLLVQPLRLGADLVLHSVSKYLGGHSDLMLGTVVTASAAQGGQLANHRTRSGAIPGQLEAWLALRGLRTLDVRLRRQMEGAQALAQWLEAVPAVSRVHYPGLPSHPQHELARRQMPSGCGAMLAIEVAGDAECAERVCELTRIWTNTTSLGSVESLLERRGRWAGEEYLPANLIRLSVGLEDAGDLRSDLAQAFRGAGLPL
ncbi:MAG: trans-sulfuration enzyme family protein [Candidatus Dormibacteria bacterium]